MNVTIGNDTYVAQQNDKVGNPVLLFTSLSCILGSTRGGLGFDDGEFNEGTDCDELTGDFAIGLFSDLVVELIILLIRL